MGKRLCIRLLTNKTLVIEGIKPLSIVSLPMILPFLFPQKPTEPPSLSSSSWNIFLLPVMCREHPESMYHDWCLNLAAKDICNIVYFVFIYPHLFGSFVVSLPRGLINS